MAIVFGETITADDIIDQATFFDDWEAKYTFIIDLGKQLPEFSESDQNAENVVHGCQSLVWITFTITDNKFYFCADSDAIIVKGLLAVILSAYNSKTAEEIKAFDIDDYFEKLDLLNHITNVRGNGLRAMVERIKLISNS